MEWWQILIIVFVAGLFIEEAASIIAKAMVIKSKNKDKDEET